MNKVSKDIDEKFEVPCGPLFVDADSICRKSIRDDLDALLDRLTKEIYPVEITSSSVDFESEEEDPAETQEERKARLIEEGKLRAEVREEVRKYREETLQGNSKMLQDISGKLPKR